MPERLFTRLKLALPVWGFYGLMLVMTGGIVLYSKTTLTAFSAFLSYQEFDNIRFSQQSPATAESSATAARFDEALQAIQEASATDPTQPRYAAELGKYLLDHAIAGTLPPTAPAAVVETAETLLKRAIAQDPANPWYYYDLGRLSDKRGDCAASRYRTVLECPTARYYQAALRNYATSLFLRQEIGRWWLAHDPEGAHRLLRRFVVQDSEEPPLSTTTAPAKTFAKFLYGIPLDYESEQELALAKKSVSVCDQPTMIARTERLRELGRDDGSAEWYAPLTSPEQRVRKRICLPAELSAYRAAALKIFMNAGGAMSEAPHIFLDDIRVSNAGLTVALTPKWHEIPIDLRALHAKSAVSIYLRAAASSDAKDALRIWGDLHTPGVHSLFGFDQSADLSPVSGAQAGEYLIRLVLYE